MRKLVVVLFALVLALQAAVAVARVDGPCCETCHDMLACASSSCSPCTVQAACADEPSGHSQPSGRPDFPVPSTPRSRVSFDIWKPPW